MRGWLLLVVLNPAEGGEVLSADPVSGVMEEAGEDGSGLGGEGSGQGEKVWCLKRVGQDSGWLRLHHNSEVTRLRG